MGVSLSGFIVHVELLCAVTDYEPDEGRPAHWRDRSYYSPAWVCLLCSILTFGCSVLTVPGSLKIETNAMYAIQQIHNISHFHSH